MEFLMAAGQTDFCEAELKVVFNSCLTKSLSRSEMEMLRPQGFVDLVRYAMNWDQPRASTRLNSPTPLDPIPEGCVLTVAALGTSTTSASDPGHQPPWQARQEGVLGDGSGPEEATPSTASMQMTTSAVARSRKKKQRRGSLTSVPSYSPSLAAAPESSPGPMTAPMSSPSSEAAPVSSPVATPVSSPSPAAAPSSSPSPSAAPESSPGPMTAPVSSPGSAAAPEPSPSPAATPASSPIPAAPVSSPSPAAPESSPSPAAPVSSRRSKRHSIWRPIRQSS
ncbi:uncharacterized protein LOC130570622 [Triplophysa rosa]|uniref:uncharacterized protein LOC130570622 n=1 Tax=Triplophysa rosa TaxID=992332 RepID=UPI002545E428|nr:uncharacterized protein LOC130570622 [Triplophysa rosa]